MAELLEAPRRSPRRRRSRGRTRREPPSPADAAGQSLIRHLKAAARRHGVPAPPPSHPHRTHLAARRSRQPPPDGAPHHVGRPGQPALCHRPGGGVGNPLRDAAGGRPQRRLRGRRLPVDRRGRRPLRAGSGGRTRRSAAPGGGTHRVSSARVFAKPPVGRCFCPRPGRGKGCRSGSTGNAPRNSSRRFATTMISPSSSKPGGAVSRTSTSSTSCAIASTRSPTAGSPLHHVRTETPSPFTAQAAWKQTNELMYEDDVPTATAGARPDLVREMALSSHLRPRVAPELADEPAAKGSNGWRPGGPPGFVGAPGVAQGALGHPRARVGRSARCDRTRSRAWRRPRSSPGSPTARW